MEWVKVTTMPLNKHFIEMSALGIIYARIPKAANTSIKEALAEAVPKSPIDDLVPTNDAYWEKCTSGQTRLLDKAGARQASETAFCFTFVRDPLDRFVSCYADKFVRNEAAFPEMFTRSGLSPETDLAAFVDFVTATADEDLNIHVRPQSSILCHDGVLIPQFVGRFETIEQDWSSLVGKVEERSGLELVDPLWRRNETGDDVKAHVWSQLSASQTRALQERFADDYDLFYPSRILPKAARRVESASALFVVAHDSQFKWAASAGRTLHEDGWTTKYFAPSEHTKISESQISDAGIDPGDVEYGLGTEASSRWSEFDAVFFVTPGGISERYMYQLRDHLTALGRADGPRPVIVSSYVGMVVDNHVSGFLYRAPADVVCVNSPHDHQIFASASGELGLAHPCLRVTGLSILPDEVKPQKTGPIKQVVYADQAAIPKRSTDRKVIYHRLLEYARMHPRRKVIIKPRHRPDEGSFHTGKYSPEKHFRSEKMPENLVIDYTPVTALLPETDLLVTVSSTAALEGIAFGSRVAIISDVGLQEQMGNHMFIGSGLVRSFAQMIRDEIGTPDPGWVETFQSADLPTGDIISSAVWMAHMEANAGALPFVTCPYFEARRRAVAEISQINAPVKRKPASTKTTTVSGIGWKFRKSLRAILPPVLVYPSYRLAKRLGIV